MSNVMEVRVEQIKVGNRYRKDMGNMDLLAESISQIGLLQPIGIDSNYRLIFGERRLRAFEKLGRDTIPARIVHVPSLLSEHAENEIREDFKPSERVAIGKAMEEELARQAAERQQKLAGTRKDDLSKNFNEGERNVNNADIGRTDEKVAKSLGYGNHVTYRQAKTVVEKAEPELIEAMDKGEVAISTAAKLATAPAETQRTAAADPKKAIEMAKQASAAKVREIRQAAKEERRTATAEKKQSRIADIEQQAATISESRPDIPAGPFHVISIDPPWPYGTQYDPEGRRAANPYPEMNLEEIKALQLPAADNCVLWLWTTHKFMRHSFELLDTWGFRDVAILTWVKDRMGLGTWLRSQSEFCIMAIKGKPPVRLTNQTTVIHGPLREHSRKPDSFYKMVDELCVGAKLDFFSREKREGWAQVGNTTDLFQESA